MKRRARSKDKSGLPQAGVLSLLFHIALIIILGLSARLVITKVVPSVYRVAIMPFSSPGDGLPKGGPGVRPPAQDLSVPPTVEKPKTEESKKPEKVVAVAQPEQKKPEKKVEKPPKADIALVPKKQQTPAAKKDQQLAQEEDTDKSLQEAMAEIRLNVALKDMQKRVNESEGAEQQSYARGAGSSVGSGTGTGLGGGKPKEVYAGMVTAKIKQEWALSKNFPRGKVQLETVIHVIVERDGKVQKVWFGKQSGNASYDQMAMRAIKKTEPLPPFLQGMTENTEEIIITFGSD
jgi:colicin import membrane protein